jgi:hypothetical protein
LPSGSEQSAYQAIILSPSSISNKEEVSSHSGTGLAEVIADPNSRREETPIIPEDYIDKYNLVIRQYNNDINRIGYVYLSELPLHSYVSTNSDRILQPALQDDVYTNSLIDK